MGNYTERSGLRVADELVALIEQEMIPGTGVDAASFWRHYAEIISDLAPLNRALLARRDDLQAQIDSWHQARRGVPIDPKAYRAFLAEIGYLVPSAGPVEIEVRNVDPEIASLAGPQLVVPVSNARFALNAANARWGSLYDAFYGTDALPGTAKPGGYDAERGAAVVAHVAGILDQILPLETGRHGDIGQLEVIDQRLVVTLRDGTATQLTDPTGFVGHRQDDGRWTYLFRHHGLHIEFHVDHDHPVGKASAAGISDVVVEAALTTIQDCEDSVAAVDATDKVHVYRNWLGLMRGDLSETFEKSGRSLTRRLAADRSYLGVDSNSITLPGRSVMLVRNVGHLMTTDAVLDPSGNETPEGIMDALVTSLAAMHDLRRTSGPRNSRAGSIYIVKPKMHGPDEVGFANTLFDRVEEALGLARHTIKIGVMDEERRTSVNLAECIRAVRHRLVFINTGFLDRTGDEIHTSMQAGPVIPKNDIKDAIWLGTYENNNVDVGLAARLPGQGQIGKGMWAKPDAMQEMLKAKVAQPRAGASTAWVPSPTAATLHAIHYHQVDVPDIQRKLADRQVVALDDILTPPLLDGRNLSPEQVKRELDNNAQGILGYVVRWIDQGVGCSKVPDIDNVALMEDRATLRISSQHIANWLLHGLITPDTVVEAFRRMASVVDSQNRNDKAYRPMTPDWGASIAFAAALELALEGGGQPNGYTEPILHRRRRQFKAAAS
ncbi:malate synthase G 1 [Devosia yakushimensis]|uniref:Malate synthase G n=1 Tax=Devosia yakushimensis TaxID=470028 RepID=A0ABQ5UJW5_9HYPH|nr:malate synthase G [Devosia yakushimensis]GLQ11923.1 malate synthase G 1 [Devosia yakushimensis]